MKKIIIDCDTCTMILDSDEFTEDRVRPAIDAIADAVEELGLDGVEVVREYRTTGRRDDSSEYHVELESVLVGQVDALRAKILG